MKPKRPCVWNGVQYESIREAAAANNITTGGMLYRVQRGHTCDADLWRRSADSRHIKLLTALQALARCEGMNREVRQLVKLRAALRTSRPIAEDEYQAFEASLQQVTSVMTMLLMTDVSQLKSNSGLHRKEKSA